jgi:CheY-like chemotaxis protein/two-component sensor histidine kinase
VIDRNAHAQAQLVEDVLDTARVITGKLRLELKPVAITAIVDAAVEALRPAADAKHITIDIVRRSDPPLVRADADRLQQVFWNLLSNAVKFTPERGAITVRIDSPDSQVRVTITDTGIGLDPQFLPFVFDRFRQADQSATRGHGGLGLGLALVKHLVELHGGKVEARSDGAERGSAFSVTLPIPAVLLDGDPRAAEDPSPFTLRFSGRTILVVDDDTTTRELLGEMFDEAMADVATADSAAAAYAAVEARRPDLIIADIGLPGEDGNSLMRRIRQLPGPSGQVPAIALSAYTRSEDRELARDAGFTEFLGKPASPEDLLSAVHRLLRDR